MSRANAHAFVWALVIVLCVLSLIGAIEDHDQIAVASKARAIRAERAAQAYSVLGIQRIKLAAK